MEPVEEKFTTLGGQSFPKLQKLILTQFDIWIVLQKLWLPLQQSWVNCLILTICDQNLS